MTLLVGTGQITITDVNDGYSAALSLPSTTVPASTAGVVSSYTGAETYFKITLGITDVTSLFSYYISATGGNISYRDSDDTSDRTGTGSTTGSITGTPGYVKIVSLTQDSSYLDITATKVGEQDITRRFTVSRAKAGAPTYTWFAWAKDTIGTDISTTAGTLAYIGVASNKTTATAPSLVYTDYSWSKIVGADGAPGSSLITVSGDSDTSGSTNAYLKINGVSIGIVEPGRGHTLKVIDITTSTLVVNTFYDTYVTTSGATGDGGTSGNATALADAINAITNTNYVIVLYSSDATECTTLLRTAINNKGGSSDLTWTSTANPTTYSGYSHVFIGAPGLLKGQGFEKVNSVTVPNSGYSTPVAVNAYYTKLGLVVNGVAGSPGYTPVKNVDYFDGTSVTGPSGAQTFRAYIKTTNSTTTPVTNPPAATTDGAAPTGWSLTPVSLTGSEAQWQSDGKIAAGQAGIAANTIWSSAYLSYFKVAELSAITANIGTFKSAPIGNNRTIIKDSMILVVDNTNKIRVRIGDLSTTVDTVNLL